MTPSRCVLLVLAFLTTVPAAADGQPGTPSARSAETCAFFHGQAFHKGISHFSTELLWACEAIRARRAAEMPLGTPLETTETAMDRYRAAVIAAGTAAFVASRAGGVRPSRLGLSDEVKSRLAAETGVLAALDAIRDGF